MAWLLGAGSWLWLVFVGASIGAGALAARRGARRAAAAIGVGAVLLGIAIFGVLPALALRGEVFAGEDLSPCDESPGSGCSACLAEYRSQGQSTDPCHQAPLGALGLAIAGLGPLVRTEALERAAHDQRWMLR